MRALTKVFIVSFCLIGFTASAFAEPTKKSDNEKKGDAPGYSTVVLMGLNKVTGHTSKLEGPVGTLMTFGNLQIVARRCWKSAPEERPENAALLDISETRQGEAPKQAFLGWMFSSSPGLSGLEHPVYDITVLACETKNDDGK
jgi:hypothetical protein